MINKVGKLVKSRFNIPLVLENNGIRFVVTDDILLITDVSFVGQESHDVRNWKIEFLSLGRQWTGFSNFLDNIPTYRVYSEYDVYRLSFQELV